MKAKHATESSPDWEHRRTQPTHEHSDDSAVATTSRQPQQKFLPPLAGSSNSKKLFACNLCTMSFGRTVKLTSTPAFSTAGWQPTDSMCASFASTAARIAATCSSTCASTT
ncbi:hypothetical protein LSAT2_021703, partial [Lamellibrachia satsuma]